VAAKVVCFINYKGGVGKSTSTYHVGCYLAQYLNQRVLLLDIDPQTNLTFLCSAIENWQRFKRTTGTIASLYRRFQDRQSLDTKRFIWRSPVSIGRHSIANLDLIPCDIDLLGEDLGGGQVLGTFPTLEAMRRNATEYLRERSFLSRALKEVESDYDYVLIDCPPNLYLMTQNALLASQKFVVPTIPDHLSTIGLSILLQKVEKIGQLVTAAGALADATVQNMQVATLGGIVFVRVRLGGTMLTTAHASKMAELRQNFPGSCFPTYTTELIGYTEAAAAAMPVWGLQNANAIRAAQKGEYDDITREFVRKV